MQFTTYTFTFLKIFIDQTCQQIVLLGILKVWEREVLYHSFVLTVPGKVR